jgi:4-aminobutyrate aminotransferase-like enzyme/Ser/Thr protein kinase RdoA (MazF antagonist)
MSPVMSEPIPVFGPPDAERVAASVFGVTGTATMLRSERDRNFLLRMPGADERLVLKVSNSAETAGMIELENGAMAHVARQAPALPIPRLIPAADGALAGRVAAADGREHVVRLLSVVPGAAADGVDLQPGFAGELGRTSALLARALRGFLHPAAQRYLEWDPRQVERLRPALAAVPDAGRREQLARLLDRLADLPERTANLPAQVAHGDFTLSNILTADGRSISGVVDFGDMHWTARVADLAISLAALLRVAPSPWPAASAFLDGYQGVQPLEEDEVEVLGDLVLARLVATVIISRARGASDAGHAATVADLERGSWAILDALRSDDGPALTGRLRRMTGLARVSATLTADPTLLGRRQRLLGGSLSPLFYRQPLQMTRGQGPWMWGSDGTRYLDAYNNVPVVGHAHPAVAQAIGQQSRLLNISSRYLHPNLVELAERLLATLPDSLDTCLLVNSGSEANDLAWRMATVFTGRGGAIVTDSAYHGVSAATAALSSNTWLAGQRPGHVATYPAPAALADGAAPGRADAAARIDGALAWLAGRGLEVALSLADPMFTSGGILDASAGFMTGLADAVHDAGGLFLADEVQAGFGRSGTGLWSFARHGITPDFVTLGKPMGNGHPVAALITRSDIAARFAQVDEFFSTFGGNPVSCAAALTVLDIVTAEKLVERSAAHGRLLRARITELGRDGPQPMAVRGSGLFAGIDFGGAAGLAARLVERLRQEHILVSNTGPGGRVLKVRPPLIWTGEHVDIFVSALKRSVEDTAGRAG